jgi:hypothetical protein
MNAGISKIRRMVILFAVVMTGILTRICKFARMEMPVTSFENMAHGMVSIAQQQLSRLR